VLDYDDLLLYWFHLLGDETLVALLNERFDHILVDEYQDTNRLQSSILHRMRSLNRNLTVHRFFEHDAQGLAAPPDVLHVDLRNAANQK
jgi:ATP-dependent exoDNAse (exonuclease V) beta subunit